MPKKAIVLCGCEMLVVIRFMIHCFVGSFNVGVVGCGEVPCLILLWLLWLLSGTEPVIRSIISSTLDVHVGFFGCCMGVLCGCVYRGEIVCVS